MPTTYIPTIKKEKAHDGEIWCVDWSRNTNLVASGSCDNNVKIWDGTSGELLWTLEGHTLGVISVHFSTDGTRLVSSSIDSTLCIWDMTQEGKCIKVITATPVEAWTARFHPDGTRIATGSHDGNINIYNIESGEKEESLATKNNFIMCTVFSNDGKYLAGGSQDGSIYVFNMESDQLAHTLSTHALAVRTLSFAPDNKTLISGNDDKCIYVYDVEHGQLASVLTGHSGWILSVATNPDMGKQQVCSGSADNKIKVWDLTTRSVLETQETQVDQIWGVAWNQEGNKFISVSDDGSLQWFASSGSS
ncbi:WD40-repeat-containing domain protein [Halteromyces radiatus]|uniref:WD40-repeat-containing domain protein n=1 Tax=Halteromyces radiatus TaxID=101107 RepID=UPI00221FA9E9|nr:WD40-repeat-containing domain protein [Halteromyces radiatus]KAI8084760.1 WD40-repeat-containing domain protein [Halteromyces radiatus]